MGLLEPQQVASYMICLVSVALRASQILPVGDNGPWLILRFEQATARPENQVWQDTLLISSHGLSRVHAKFPA